MPSAEAPWFANPPTNWLGDREMRTSIPPENPKATEWGAPTPHIEVEMGRAPQRYCPRCGDDVRSPEGYRNHYFRYHRFVDPGVA